MSNFLLSPDLITGAQFVCTGGVPEGMWYYEMPSSCTTAGGRAVIFLISLIFEITLYSTIVFINVYSY